MRKELGVFFGTTPNGEQMKLFKGGLLYGPLTLPLLTSEEILENTNFE